MVYFSSTTSSRILPTLVFLLIDFGKLKSTSSLRNPTINTSTKSNVRVIVKDTSEKRTLSQWCPVDVTTIAELAQYLPNQIGDIDTKQLLNLLTDVAQSSNPKEGNGTFDNSRVVHETLGALQIVPAFFSQAAPNPYIVKIYKDNGSGGVGTEIPLLDNIDWNVDTYNGILFVQDYNASKIPAHARAFIYVGDMAKDAAPSNAEVCIC